MPLVLMISLAIGFCPVTPVYAPIYAFTTVRTSPMILSVIPATASPDFADARPFMPKTNPTIVTGAPTMGKNHATRPMIPSTKDVVAFLFKDASPDCGIRTVSNKKRGVQSRDVHLIQQNGLLGVDGSPLWWRWVNRRQNDPRLRVNPLCCQPTI